MYKKKNKDLNDLKKSGVPHKTIEKKIENIFKELEEKRTNGIYSKASLKQLYKELLLFNVFELCKIKANVENNISWRPFLENVWLQSCLIIGSALLGAVVTEFKDKIAHLLCIILSVFIYTLFLWIKYRRTKYDNRRYLLIYTIDLAIEKRKENLDDISKEK